MATQTDVKQRLAALRATLAGATKACPDCDGTGRVPAAPHLSPASGFALCRSRCQGTGEVARFPEFRQDCYCQGMSNAGRTQKHHGLAKMACNGTGWQVHAGGMEDALAGLSVGEFWEWRQNWAGGTLNKGLSFDKPMPDRDTILAKTLELVIKVVGLEVPPACAS